MSRTQDSAILPPRVSSRRTVLVSIALAVLTAAVYWPVTRSEFVNYDDPDYVTENSVVQHGVTTQGLKWAFGNLHGERTYWHPLTWISHMLDCQFFGLNPRWHHAMSLLFHIANSILLLLLLSNLTGAFWPSAAVAVLFAVHPLQVETVAWVTERKNLLSIMFWLLTSAAYVRFARTKRPAPYLLALILFACGLMSKPAVVTLPCVLLLLDVWPLNRLSMGGPWRDRARTAGKLLVEKLPFFALSATSAAITMVAHDRIGMKQEIHGLPALYRIENAVVSYAQYLKKLFFPFDLAIPYPHPGVWPRATVILAALLLIGVTVFVLLQLKKRPWFAVGWFWFLGVLVPAIGIIQVGYQAMADRFVYVPIIGLLIMLAWGAKDVLTALRATPLAIATLFAGVLVYFGGATTSQVRHWKDSEALFRRAVAVTHHNYIAHLNLAVALFKKGNSAEAEVQARQAQQISPNEEKPLVLIALLDQARNDFPSAVSNFHRALALRPDSAPTRYMLARALAANGQLAQAKEEFLRLADVPQYKTDAHSALGDILGAEKNFPAAIQHYRQALQTMPEWPPVLNNLAWLLATNPDAQLRNGAEAVQLAQRACELTKNEEPLFVGTLAAAYAEAGRFPDAVATTKRAQALSLQKGLTDLAQRNADALKLYEAGKPLRDPPPKM